MNLELPRPILLGAGVKSWKGVKTARACRHQVMEKSWKRSACRHVVFFGLRASTPAEDFTTSLKRRRRPLRFHVFVHDFVPAGTRSFTPFHDLTPVPSTLAQLDLAWVQILDLAAAACSVVL